MEGDDEFGDLYADVLLPFASTSSSAPQPPQSSAASPSSSRSLDLNLQTDHEEILHGASYANSDVPHQSSDQTTSTNQGNSVKESILAAASNSMQAESAEGASILEGGDTKPLEGAKILELGDAELAESALPDMNHDKESGIDDVGSEVAVNGDGSIDKYVNFDIEEVGEGLEDVGSDPIIPGLSSGGVVVVAEAGEKEADDWDSDSEDDLPIVLCDNNNMKVERGGMMGDDDDDDDGDEDSELVIVADGDPNQAVEEQEWGENTAQTADGERKDMCELAKASGGVTMAPKIGYSSHGYHPFHSQFKYVRPGAATMPGTTTCTPGVSTGQIHLLANMVPMAGRGRGDWRPPGIKGAAALQKGFHAGPGLPVWGNGAAGRGFGGGLEFTLPSHKTIFDVDVESFEGKPWKYPGVDASDFFNFGLNEETWKDYCRQLEQLRLESTMQSKIRVYESGRSEQEYDPDLPPELAAASGIHDNRVENTNFIRSNIGRNDLAKASRLVRPSLPTGRAIQVETGYGERLPSVDTRPPRIRDSDAIIEIVLQDSADDNSFAAVGVQDQSEGREPQREDFREDDVAGDEIPRVEHEYFDGFSLDYNGRKGDLVERRMPFYPADIPVGDAKEPADYLSSRGQIPRSSGVNFGSSFEERRMQGKASSCITPIRDKAIVDNGKEDSVESMEGRYNANLSSPMIKDARGSSVEDKDADLDETGSAAENSMEKEDIDLNTVDKSNTLKDREEKRQNSISQVEEPLLDDVNDWENSRAARSSDNSKGSSVRSKDYQKQQDEEELVQDAQSAHLGSNRRFSDKNGHDFRGREHDGKQEPERNCLLHKGREKSYPYKDQHLGSAHQLQMKTGGFDRKKDADNSDVSWARRDDDPFGRRVRNDEPRKREKGKVRENERSDRDGSLHSRKQLDNGRCRVPHDKNLGLRDSRYRERDDIMKSRYGSLEDCHSKRRKDEGYLRRDNIDKDGILHGYIENASRHRRERDLAFDPQKRNDPQRSGVKLDDHYASRRKDELPKERADRQRDMDLKDWHRVKQSHEEHPSKREREEGRTAGRSGRGAEEKTWVGHVRGQDERQGSVKKYQSRDTMRPSEQLKRRDRIQDESSHHKECEDAYTHRNQCSGKEKRSKQERSTSRSGHAANASDNQRANGRMDKEGTQRSKESGISDPSSFGLSKSNQDGQSGPSQTTNKGLKDLSDEGRTEQEIPGHRLSRKCQEDISSDDEQEDSHRGRSKLECWKIQKERDFNMSCQPSSSSKFKDIDKDNKEGSSEAGKSMVESAKTFDPVDNQHLLSTEGNDSVDMESKDADTNGLGDQHLNTAEKLKKRSERFKLPMPSEKETLTIKKLESEPLPSAKSKNSGVSEVKQERPARKRRWISN